VLVAIAILIVISQMGKAMISPQPDTSTPPAATSPPTYPPLPTLIPTDTPTPAPNSIGQPVVVNADWTVTLNKVFKSTGDSFNTPKAGYIYLVVNVTLLNTSGQNQTASTLAQWSLKDESGQTYEQDIFFSGSPDGSVRDGGKIRGNITYEVPKSIHRFILQFVPDIGATDLAEWNVSI